MAEGTVKAVLDTISANTKRDGETVQPKDFFWDQFVKYISSAILAQVLLTFSLSFFRNERVSCFHPPDTFSFLFQDTVDGEAVYQFARDQAAFINKYCEDSTPVTEYFPLFILVHGLLLAAPHYIWSAIHKGDFDSFFSIAEKIERLRRSETGKYSKDNFDRVAKLEKEYGGSNNKIFWTYIGKLLVQLSVCIISIGFSAGYLTDFSFSFDCPSSLVENEIIPHGWPLNVTVPCVYASLRSLYIIRYVDFILTALAGALIMFGLIWCVSRHNEQLGYRQVALFVFQSFLSPESFDFPPIIRYRGEEHLKLLQKQFDINPIWKYFMWFVTHKIHSFNLSRLFDPGIRNDLDFLLLLLFRADASHGKVFKNIQISQELEELTGRDHQLLHLYISIQNDIDERAGSVEPFGQTQYYQEKVLEELRSCWSCCYGRGRAEASEELSLSTAQGESRSNGLRNRKKNVTQQHNSQSHEEKPSDWVKFKATCLLNFCCCCFRKKQKKKKIARRANNMDSRLEHDFRKLFLESGFNSERPEKLAYYNFAGHMGNVELLYQDDVRLGMRDIIYWFVSNLGRKRPDPSKNNISNDIALDVTFGSIGYQLALARAFKIVYSIQFHPYYRNPKEVIKKEMFYTNYTIITCPDNIYASNNVAISEMNTKIIDNLKEDHESDERKVDMILVGPITNESHKVSFNILLNTLSVSEDLNKRALLLAVRPLRIGTKKCSFFKYEPPEKSFERYSFEELEMSDKERKLCRRSVDNEWGFKLICGGVSCIVECEAYWYIGGVVEREPPVDLGNGESSFAADNMSYHIPISSDVSVETTSNGNPPDSSYQTTLS